MEDLTKIESPSISEAPQTHHRLSLPDVPEDVEDQIVAHFNDPNWDYRTSSSISTDDVESPPSYLSGDMGTTTTEFDTASQLSSLRKRGSKADLSYKAIQVQESPYPEVRAAVANTDDPDMAVSTFRAWFLGVTFCILVSTFNTVIVLRLPYVVVNALLVQIIALPCGKFLQWALPKYRFSVFGFSFSLNPGPFTIKEHTLIAIMANIVVNGTAVVDIASASRLIFGHRWSIGNQILLGAAPQFLGFAFAGCLRQFLVWPASMIWPGVLVRCALLNTMHSNYGKSDARHMSRERFLYIVFACSFLYFWIPGYLWTGLSLFNWVCWIAPSNVIVNSLFGSLSGFGMGLLTFDWAQVSIFGNPLVIPWWAQVNTLGGFVVVIWLICPILWAKNVFYSQYMPVSVIQTYDNTGAPYNLSAIVTNGTFDQAKYENYSPMFLPINYAVTYGTLFATYPALLVHTFLWYRRDIVHQLRRSLKDEQDIHSYLIRRYPEVPRWWFVVVGVLSFVIGIISIEILHIDVSIWMFIFSMILAIIFVIPMGILQAITNQSTFSEVLSEFIAGYVHPGHPMATMVFRTISGSLVSGAIYFCSDLKFGHYMKVPPRIVFIGQIVAAAICLVNVLIAEQWALDNIPDICKPHQKHFFTCPDLNVFLNSSIFWGGIGPKRYFSSGAIYYPMTWFFLIGAVLPIPFYYLARRNPRSLWRYVNIPIALNGPNSVPPLNGVNVVSWVFVGFFFQFFMRRYHFRWWMRYNYLLASGLDAGVIFALVVIFFSVQFPKGGITLNWWGNTVWQRTADFNATALKTVPSGQFFGPRTWT